MKIVTETMDRDKFFLEWQKQVLNFEVHVRTMKTQYLQTRVLKEHLPDHEIVIHMDFAENYMCKTSNEIQSAYWNASMVTLHPMVVYFRNVNDQALAHKSYVAVSDTLSHSSGTVLTILEQFLMQEIDLPGCAEINCVHYFTDSPTSQYRNRFIFHTIQNHESLFGCPATWNYYEAGHGKNVCDGLGCTVKRLADDAVKAGKANIQDAEDFIRWTEGSSMKGVTFFFVSKEQCDQRTTALHSIDFQPIKGTLQIHAVKVDSDGNFCTRTMSCYCELCISGRKCDTWEIHGSKPETQAANDSYYASEDLSTNTVNVGDFVAALYDGNWYIGQVKDDDIEDGEMEVSFMEKKNSLFQWPRNEDCLWIKRSDVLCKVNPPAPCGKSMRMYKLEEADSIIIERIVNNM